MTFALLRLSFPVALSPSLQSGAFRTCIRKLRRHTGDQLRRNASAYEVGNESVIVHHTLADDADNFGRLAPAPPRRLGGLRRRVGGILHSLDGDGDGVGIRPRIEQLLDELGSVHLSVALPSVM